MQPKTPKWLEDVRSSAEIILTATTGKTLEQFRADVILRAAVERHFEIIGEAVGRIAKHDPQTASRIGESSRIIAFRNILIHGYDVVDQAEVWKIVIHHLPRLQSDVQTLLKESAEKS